MRSSICNHQFSVPLPRLARAFLFVNVVGLLLVALWFRCRSLENIPGVNGDEAWYGVKAVETLQGGGICVQTPTGNPINPFFFVPLVLLHTVFAPSVTVLRSVAVISGVAALAVNWFFCRWVFDRRTAAISTLALAVLPINLAYGRFAWDASQSLLATLPVLYCSLAAVRFPARRDLLLAAAILALLAAVLVHPTNIFAGAAIAAALAASCLPRFLGSRGQFVVPPSGGLHGTCDRPFRLKAGLQTPPLLTIHPMIVFGLALLTLTIWATHLVKASGPSRVENLRQLVQPDGLPHFSVLYPRLFSGGTVYRYIPGTHSWSEWPGARFDDAIGLDVLVFWAIVLAAAWTLWRGAGSDRQTDRAADRVLVVAWLLQLAGFLVVAGPWAMAPNAERFAMGLIAPTVVLAARGAAAWWSGLRRGPLAVAAAGILAGWFCLADFQEHYFGHIERTGSDAHRAFQTAAVEPKQAALDYIVAHRGPGTNWIVAGDWWSYWPLRYLAMADGGLRVLDAGDANAREELGSVAADDRVWYLEFSESQELPRIRAMLLDSNLNERQLLDYSGRPVLSVLHAGSPIATEKVGSTHRH